VCSFDLCVSYLHLLFLFTVSELIRLRNLDPEMLSQGNCFVASL
jgi:hypothetical protein